MIIMIIRESVEEKKSETISREDRLLIKSHQLNNNVYDDDRVAVIS